MVVPQTVTLTPNVQFNLSLVLAKSWLTPGQRLWPDKKLKHFAAKLIGDFAHRYENHESVQSEKWNT